MDVRVGSKDKGDRKAVDHIVMEESRVLKPSL